MRVQTIADDGRSVTKRFGDACEVRVERHATHPVRFAVTAEGETWECEVSPLITFDDSDCVTVTCIAD